MISMSATSLGDSWASFFRRVSDFLESGRKSRWFLFGVAILFIAMVISRRPDVVTHPQFYAEDGVFWFSEAYNARHFWEPFLVPKQRYFQTVSRVGGIFGSLVDIAYAPLVFNAIAIAFQILPALYFLSSRFEGLVRRFSMRLLCGLGYLSLLGTAETHANLTNVQWRLALLMFLIVIAPESGKVRWRIFDNGILLLAGLSGPFVFFMLPVTFARYRFKSFGEYIDRIAVLSVAFLIQLYSYIFMVSDATRSAAPLGASIMNFFNILAGNIFMRGILGTEYVGKLRNLSFWENGFLPIFIGIIGILMLGYVFWKAKIELRLFMLFAFLVLAGAMYSPQVSLVKPQWQVMAGGGGGGRYWFFPTLAWIISLGWIYFNGKRGFLKNFAGILLLCFLFVGLPKDWVFSKYKDYHFDRQVSEFKKADVGQAYTFKIVPKWDMTLVRK